MTSNGNLPPFPADTPTHSLEIIDHKKVISGDKQEEEKLWNACTTQGFFYLKNHHMDADPMWKLGKVATALPLEEKMKYEQGDMGVSSGFKLQGMSVTDEHGSLDTVEFLNISRDDALNRPEIAEREYPSVVEERMPDVKAFIESCDEVTRGLMDVLSDRLGLPREVLRERHNYTARSPSEMRLTKTPPRPVTQDQIALGAHTDFGTLSVLHTHILGGLQVLGNDGSWKYIKPLPGHVVCNVGDSLHIYSGGIFSSCMHRVMPPPGEQRKFERWSLVYFLRPANASIMEPLTQSTLVAEQVKARPIEVGVGQTQGEWYARRLRLKRVANRTGPETWFEGRGTEGNRLTL